jgi:2-dehydro-3-deoxyphosphogluconate aldolase/(4S)-4-hydroxy-2-oxoglutarate aldolase
VGAVTIEARELDVVRRLEAIRILPLATLEDPGEAEGVATALVAGGVPCLEVTFRTPAAEAALRRACEVDGLLVGAGTILTLEQAEVAAAAGAAFALAPGTNEDVVRRCRELGLPCFPGVATPSEVERARALGLRALKVFPAEQLGGAPFLRALAGPYPDVRFIPTGGIGPGTLADYLALPSVLAVGGSWLVAPDLLRAGDYAEIERRARDAAAMASSA